MRLRQLVLQAACVLWTADASAQPSPEMTAQQYDALFADMEPGAAFTGMPLRIKDATGSPLNMVAVF